jgi:hypothetical protein
MKTRFVIWGLLAIVGCSTKQDNQTVGQKMDAPKKDKQIRVSKDIILYENLILHNFSSPVAKDSFKIQVAGQTIIDGEIKFQIITDVGQVILNETFPASMFLDYGLKEEANDREKEVHIKDRIDRFFDTANFHQPAIARNDTYDEDYTSREVWDDIISDQSSVGFDYLIGEEDHRFVVYSKSRKKIVTYYNCC